jgi:hypothetical protein
MEGSCILDGLVEGFSCFRGSSSIILVFGVGEEFLKDAVDGDGLVAAEGEVEAVIESQLPEI